MTELVWVQSAWDAMLAHAAREKPREACGALIGEGNQVNAVAPMTNLEASAEHYRICPKETLALFEAVDEGGVELLGWYHSHPRTSSRPSDLDLDLAVPGFIYVVCGVDGVTTFSR
jgi:proteasome lid subunit RPN8/RPN11